MTLLLVGVVLVGVVVLTPLADRLRVPQPILLLVFGLLVALVPGLPALTVDADLILPVEGSGVLAVLVLGLYLRQRATRAFTSQGSPTSARSRRRSRRPTARARPGSAAGR